MEQSFNIQFCLIFFVQILDLEVYLVINWGRDLYFGMVYFYIFVGLIGEEYDYLVCDIDNRVFFVGEVGLVVS